MATNKTPGWTFEAGLTALEDISLRMEAGDLPLEEALRLYEEGKALQKRLIDQLDASEKRLTVLEAGVMEAPSVGEPAPPQAAAEAQESTDAPARGEAPAAAKTPAAKAPAKARKKTAAAQTMLEVEP